jgi:hypothetical protein
LPSCTSEYFRLPIYYQNIKIKIYKTIFLPVVLHEFETWSLTLRKEHRLRVNEDRMLRRIFGPERDEVTGGWRKLHNEECYNLYSSPTIIRKIRALVHMGKIGNGYKFWLESLKGRHHSEDLGIDGRIWIMGEIGCEGME